MRYTLLLVANLTALFVCAVNAQSVDPGVIQPIPVLVDPPLNSGRLGNISTRGFVGPEPASLIAGFVVTEQDRYVLIRGVGPSLATFGINAFLRKPRLSLFDSRGALIATTTSWSSALTSGDRQGVALVARSVGAFPLLTGSDDAVLHLRLSPGAYTAVVESTDSQSGVAVVEVYISQTYRIPSQGG